MTVLCAQLAAGATLRDAAVAADMAERTARRRWKDPDVQALVQRMVDERAAAVTSELVALSHKAVATLAAVMDDPDASSTAKVRAATATLSLTIRYQEHSFERRLAALEDAGSDLYRGMARYNLLFRDDDKEG
jgi:hypothetical protein